MDALPAYAWALLIEMFDMSENTKIEWATHTFNPWIGCTQIGPGCDHCYAKADFEVRRRRAVWGAGQPRSRTSNANWRQPLRWNKAAQLKEDRWSYGIRLHRDNEAACIAHGFIKPQRPKVFCASLADVFDNEVDPQWRAELLLLIDKTPNLDWLLLTKRVGNVGAMLDQAEMTLLGSNWTNYSPRENVWIGATICNQTEADRDIPKLLAVPAAKRFLSMEPLLGPVDLTRIAHPNAAAIQCVPDPHINALTGYYDMNAGQQARVDWVICGGESGPEARPMHPDWVRSLRDQCQAAGVPFTFKQWGEFMPADADDCDPGYGPQRYFWSDGAQWRRGDGQRGRVELMCKVGKKAAGRMLDGCECNGVPA